MNVLCERILESLTPHFIFPETLLLSPYGGWRRKMLDTFFTQIKVRSRMESGPVGPYLSAIAALLHCNGYARSTILRHLFRKWSLQAKAQGVLDLNPTTGC